MSKKLKRILAASALLAFSAASITGLVSCGNDEPTTPPEPPVETVFAISKITISNKADLIKDYSETDGARTMEIAVESNGETNALSLIMSGEMKVSSSDTNVATVSGLTITPVGGGKTTIKVESKDGKVSDSVEITIKALDTSKAVSLRTIKDSEENNTFITKAQIVGQCAGGFFIADLNEEGKQEFMYVYYEMPGGLEVGKTYYFQSKRGEYSGIAQLTSTDFFAKPAPANEQLNITADFSNVPTSEELNKFTEKDSKLNGDIIPGTLTLTVYDDFGEGEDSEAFLWIDKGFDEKTCVYTGYMSPNIIPEGIKINDRYEMKGFFSGSRNADGFANRINFYPVQDLVKKNSYTVTKLTASVEKGSLRQGESTFLHTAVEEDGAAAKVTYVVTEGKEFVDDSVFLDKEAGSLVSNKIKSKKGSAGTIKVKAVDENSNVESETIEIAVTEEVYTPVSIANIHETVNDETKGQTALVYGIYTNYIQDYGVIIEDGDKALLLYQAKKPSFAVGTYVTAEGTTDFYNDAPQLKDVTIEKAEVTDLPATPAKATPVDLSKGPSELSDADTMRTGTFTGVAQADASVNNYGNVTLTIKAGDIQYSVYADSRYTPSDVLDKLSPVKSGDTVEVTGYYLHSRKQISYPTAATVTKGTGPAVEPEKPLTPVIDADNPSFADVAIGKVVEEGKLGLWQQKREEALYFTGEMNGYYLASTTDFKAAAEITVTKVSETELTLEITSGTNAGKFIGAAISGTHNNVLIQEDAFNWTYNVANNAYTAKLSDEVEVVLGNYSNYDTFSLSTIDHIDDEDYNVACVMSKAIELK